MHITKQLWEAAKLSGITLDRFGQRLEVGDKILVKGFGSQTYNSVAEIKKINKVNIKVDVKRNYHNWDDYRIAYKAYMDDPINIAKPSYNLVKSVSETIEISRHPIDVIKAKELIENAEKEQEFLASEHPEIFV